MKKVILQLITLAIILYACKSNSYSIKQKRFYIFESSYNKLDTIYISNYIQYNIVKKSGFNNYSEIQLNEDSLFSLFYMSLKKTELPIRISNETKNLKSEEFKQNPLLKYRKINVDEIIRVCNNIPNGLTLVPIINLMFAKHTNISTSGADKYPQFICFLDIAIFLIKNEKIIYFKNMFHSESVDSEYHPYKFEDFKISIPQEHWDSLVKEVMREYLERRK